MDDGEEFAADHPLLGDELQFVRESSERGCDQDDDVIVVNPFVTLGVLPFEVGVDRHLGDTASTDLGNPIDSDRATLLADEILGRFRDGDVHGHRNRRAAETIP